MFETDYSKALTALCYKMDALTELNLCEFDIGNVDKFVHSIQEIMLAVIIFCFFISLA